MLSEHEFDTLQEIRTNKYLKPDQFESYIEFDGACEIAGNFLYKSGLITTDNTTPFQKNYTGKGATYTIAGKFNLTSEGLKIAKNTDYRTYTKSLPKESIWTLNNRLGAWGIAAAIISIVVTLPSYW